MEHEGDPSSHTVSLLSMKIFLGSVIYDAYTGARFCTADMKIHYIQSPMKNFQYMHIPLKHFIEEICDEYNIMDIAENGYVYIEICKGICGIKRSRKIWHLTSL